MSARSAIGLNVLYQDVPITNYGIAIAYMQGILKRSVSMFPYLAEELPD